VRARRRAAGRSASLVATAPEVKVASTVELQATEGFVIVDLNAESQICFIEVLHRPDVKYLLEEHYLVK
jgi:hypothetical protein